MYMYCTMPFSDRRVDDVLAFLKAFMYQLLQSFYSKYHLLKPIMLFLFLFFMAYLFTLFPLITKIPYFAAITVRVQSRFSRLGLFITT